MFSRSRTLSHYSESNMRIWFAMAFLAGAMNAGGFMACHRFVTHVTGFATFFGFEFAQNHWTAAFGMLTAPLFFLLGSMVSALFVERRIAQNLGPLYHWMFLAITGSLIGVSLLGQADFFGPFGVTYEGFKDYLLLAILCSCSGIQNATITSASGSVVRTTHLTGITTDLGIGLVRVLTHSGSPEVLKTEKKANLMRFGIIFSFVVGSTLAAFVFFQSAYSGFLMPAFVSLILFATSYRHHLRLAKGHHRV